MEVGRSGKLGAPAVQRAAEEYRSARAAAQTQHRRTMGRTARGLRTSLRAVTTEAAQVNEEDRFRDWTLKLLGQSTSISGHSQPDGLYLFLAS